MRLASACERRDRGRWGVQAATVGSGCGIRMSRHDRNIAHLAGNKVLGKTAKHELNVTTKLDAAVAEAMDLSNW